MIKIPDIEKLKNIFPNISELTFINKGGYKAVYKGIINNSNGQIKQTYGLILGPGNVTNSGYLAYINFTTLNISGQSLLDLFDVGITNETAYFPNINANG